MADEEDKGRKVDKQAGRTGRFLKKTVSSHQRHLEEAIQSLEKRIDRQLRKLKTTRSNRVTGAKVNLKQAQRIHADLSREFQETYGLAARSVVANYDEMAKFIRRNFKELDIAAKWTAADRTIISRLKSTSYQRFLEFSTTAQDDIARVMYQFIAAQGTFDELQQAVEGILIGHKDVRGRSMLVYAKGFAFDSAMEFHNSVNVKKAKDAGLNHFRYMGTIQKKRTRKFCSDIISGRGRGRGKNRIFTKEEIESWVPNWQGASGPALTHRGGYNCRHHWQPVDPKWFEETKKAA